MRHLFVGAWALVVCQFVAFAQQAPPKSSEPAMTPAQAEFSNVLDERIKGEWEAIKHKDQKAYAEFLTDDFIAVETDGNGERYKWKALSELQISAVTDYTLSFLKVTPLCADAAFVRYEVFVRFPPKSLVKFEKLLVGEVWVKRDGAWKSMHYQETRVK
jgi:hypothetical protein